MHDKADKEDFYNQYYEHHWSTICATLTQREEERIEQTLNLIPQDVESILDVGCGDGRITNRLVSKYKRVVGLDSSQEALKYVEPESILGSLENLPFPERSFDLVVCCEVLEHLPVSIYFSAVEEIQRVAMKYIIITVPNSENLKNQFIACPVCGCSFHPSRHLRSYNQEKLTGLFTQFSPLIIETCMTEKLTPSVLIKLARSFKVIPSQSFPTSAMCPQCGYSLMPPENANKVEDQIEYSPFIKHAGSLIRKLMPGKKKGGWLLALYQRAQ